MSVRILPCLRLGHLILVSCIALRVWNRRCANLFFDRGHSCRWRPQNCVAAVNRGDLSGDISLWRETDLVWFFPQQRIFLVLVPDEISKVYLVITIAGSSAIMKTPKEHKKLLDQTFNVPQLNYGLLTEEEREALLNYGSWLSALEAGRISPFTQDQKEFIAVCKGERPPNPNHRLHFIWLKLKSIKRRQSQGTLKVLCKMCARKPVKLGDAARDEPSFSERGRCTKCNAVL